MRSTSPKMRAVKGNCDEEKCKAFLNYYAAQCGCSRDQSGGSLPVFIGSQHQYGAGLGDILRGIFRREAPIIGPALKSTLGTFLGETGSAMNQGMTIKDSLRSALKPTLETAVTSTIDNIKKAHQSGGRKRSRSLMSPRAKRSKKKNRSSARGVYKAMKSRASKTRKRKLKFNKSEFLNF